MTQFPDLRVRYSPWGDSARHCSSLTLARTMALAAGLEGLG